MESSLLPSPNSSTSNSSTTTNPPPSPIPITISDSNNPYPITFVQADTTSFKQVVQLLTGSSETVKHASTKPEPTQKSQIPPIKSNRPGFKLYERRNSLKNFKINPLNPINSGFSPSPSPRKHEIFSPSILDFPSLVLSRITPLTPDPFDRSRSANCGPHARNPNTITAEAEERAIKEKGFYLHPSPSTTPRDSKIWLLPLFPTTSPRVSGSSAIFSGED